MWSDEIAFWMRNVQYDFIDTLLRILEVYSSKQNNRICIRKLYTLSNSEYSV